MKLVIIEGPGKRETLKKYLGKDFEIVATKGHIRDLPVKEFGIDFINNFEPKYIIMDDKKDVIEEIKKKAAKAETILLATDPDREGEAISWHIAHILNLKSDQKCRIVFNEISEDIVKNAVQNPRELDYKLIDAQQARRVLDRIVGYKLSPILCKKIKPKLSAGRVQSVSLKLIVDREKEITSFKPEEYWNIFALLNKLNDKLYFKSSLTLFKDKKIKVENEKQAKEIKEYLENRDFIVKNIKKTVSKTKPSPPFTTSTMQQDALNKLGIDIKTTSRIAQNLYEGVELEGEGKTALITYIRTDSVRISADAQEKTRNYIESNYGKDFLPVKPNFFTTKTKVQDAHEAIRPIFIQKTPESVKNSLRPEQYRLYKLIYDRFLASQMSEAIYNNQTIDITAGDYTFKVIGKTLIFPGYTTIYKNYDENDKKDENPQIPSVNQGEKLILKEIQAEQKFTKPPSRFTEASLVKIMEEKGIGRPATYVPTITTLFSREYTAKEGKFLYPTELGFIVTEYLENNFKTIMNVEFTAQMETSLDNISEGNKKWQELIGGFWKHFEPFIKKADYSSVKIKIPPKETDIICSKCGGKMLLREGKYGKFLGCSNFPSCKNIQSTEEKKKQMKVVSKCPKCNSDVVIRKSKKGKIFYACTAYPNCQFISWEKPTGEICKLCGEHMIEVGKESPIIKCSNSKCTSYNITK